MTAQPVAAFAGEIHPLADLYPLLPADELAALAEDIKANGQEAPILLDDRIEATP